MNLTGLMLTRNSEWCIGLTLRAALMICDQVVVLMHSCTDRTTEIVGAIAIESWPRVIVGTDNTPGWDEMRLRQKMLESGRACGATHIWLCDDDELLTGNLINTPPAGNPRPGSIACLPCYNLRGGIDRYHSSGIWANRWVSVAFADEQRFHWPEDRFHHREPIGAMLSIWKPIAHGQGGILHLWGASERRLIAKHRLYRITERLRWPEKSASEIERYYSYATDGNGPGDSPRNWRFANVPESWWAPYAHLMQHLDVDAEPWQEAECERLIAEHGIDKFAGLRVRKEDFKL